MPVRDGYDIVAGGSLTCPSPELCDIQKAITAKETYREYVLRHAIDHKLGEFDHTEDAERNLGLNCFYFDHKYLYGNPSLTPYPFWEIHSFIAEDEWSEVDLEERVPIPSKTFKRIPDAADRMAGDIRLMKQLELPRQCEKTTVGARAYSLFISKREWFVGGESNYPIMIRSATALNSRDSLKKIFKRATAGAKIKALYGVDLVRCQKCGTNSHIPKSEKRATCPNCGEKKKIRVQAISLIDPTRGAGGTSADSITFRWATMTRYVPTDASVDDPDYDPFAEYSGDETEEGETSADGDDAVYSVRAVGLRTELTGQRPRLYILDDITTKENSRTPEMRVAIESKFDQATMQVEFGGRLLVNNTRKFTADFAGKIAVEPLRTQFHTLHRRARWYTGEPDAPPYVIDGWRYYFPEKGSGRPALDKRELDRLEKRSDYPSEYDNDPTDPKQATFKREQFKIIDIHDAAMCHKMLGYQPIEVRYGLGRNLTPSEEDELASLRLSVQAYNFWDPRGSEKEAALNDYEFGVGLRLGRYGEIFVTWLDAGRWNATEGWSRVDSGNSYNRPAWNDYEMGVDERSCKASLQKWQRDEFERVGIMPMIPMHWSKMPKSTKYGRCMKMETWTSNGNFYILDDADHHASAPWKPGELIEEYISEWLGLRQTGGVGQHDDGPDATSRGIKHFMSATYQRPPKEEEQLPIQSLAGGVPFSLIKGLGAPKVPKSWGESA